MNSVRMRKTFRSDPDGYWMTLPYLLHFAVFGAFPILFAFLLVFHSWNVITPMRWVGLANLRRLVHDQQFYQALINTGYYLLINIPLQIMLALVLAVLLNQRIRLRGMFRAVFFMPVIVSGISVTILWQQLYAYNSGLINSLLHFCGLPPVPWLIHPLIAMPSIALMATWKNVGLYVVIFLAGLQNVPAYLYEAARIDGASAWQSFRCITIPALHNTMVLVVILSTIAGFSLFIEPYMMTGGGPMGSTMTGMLYIYNKAFYFGRMGYAAALSFTYALFILLVVAVLRFAMERKS